jgi:vacuolar-type H+-ATPase subunit B/Vma2
MSFINWSDPEEMLDLLAEYVADERLAERDRQRTKFLDELSSELIAIGSLVGESTREAIDRLRSIYDSQPPELGTDPALVHLGDCIQELQRIVAERSR